MIEVVIGVCYFGKRNKDSAGVYKFRKHTCRETQRAHTHTQWWSCKQHILWCTHIFPSPYCFFRVSTWRTFVPLDRDLSYSDDYSCVFIYLFFLSTINKVPVFRSAQQYPRPKTAVAAAAAAPTNMYWHRSVVVLLNFSFIITGKYLIFFVSSIVEGVMQHERW